MLRTRWSKLILGLTLATAVLCAIISRVAQQRAQDLVTSQLQALNGAPVEVVSVQLGLSGITVNGLRFLELGNGTRPWMTVESMRLQIPISRTLSSEPVPDHILIERPRLALRFDRDGQLLNKLSTIEKFSAPSPRIDIEHGSVEIAQEGREPLVASGIALQLRGPADQVQVNGTIGKLADASWKVEAQLNGEHLATQVRLSADHLAVDTNKLSNLAFVPREQLGKLRVQGATSAAFALRYQPGSPLEYEIELQPRAISVDIPESKFRITQLAGTLRLKNGMLTAEGLSCRVGDGSLTLTGELDLRERPFGGRLTGTCDDISLHRLPDEWSMPQEVAGVLHGAANLSLAVDHEEVVIRGTGEGVIEQATVFRLPTSPIRVAVDLTRLSHKTPDATTVADGTLRLDLQMDEVAVRDALPRLNVPPDRMPVTLEGNASVAAHLDVPLASFGDVATYLGNANISFAELSLAGQRLTSVAVKVNYAAGVGNLETLAGHFEGGGQFHGGGSFQPQGPIHGDLTVERIPLSFLVALSNQTVENTKGTTTGAFRISGTTQRWRSLTDWESNGNLHSDKLTLFGQEIADASARFLLKQGVVSLDEVRARCVSRRCAGSIRRHFVKACHDNLKPQTRQATFDALSGRRRSLC